MAENPKQMNFFSSLDFPGRTVLYVWEIAQKLGGTVQHYLNLVDTGELVAIDTASRAAGKTRRMLRVPGRKLSQLHNLPPYGRNAGAISRTVARIDAPRTYRRA